MKQFFTALIFGISTFNLIQGQTNQLNFDGEDDYVEINSLSPYLAESDHFTIEFWIKANLEDQTDIRSCIFAINPATSNGNGLLIIIGGLYEQEGRLMIYDEGTYGIYADYVSDVIIADDKCHHIAYVRNEDLGSIYIDGVLVGIHETTYTLQLSDLFSLGQEWDNLLTTPTTSQFFNGSIDDLRIWETARTSDEIIMSMMDELSGDEPDLVAYYNFNQGVPGSDNGDINFLNDLTINELDGNLVDFTLDGMVSNWARAECMESSGIGEIEPLASKITLYPNPSHSFINIAHSLDNIKNIYLMDHLGNIISAYNSKTQTISIEDLANGIYFLQFITDDGSIIQKFIKT